MNLIDADEMIKRLEEWNTSDDTDKAFYNFTMRRIIEQPTAFDINKVIDQLEEIFDRWGLDDGKKEIMREIVKGGAE